jgi:outer membrane immunogenic protein
VFGLFDLGSNGATGLTIAAPGFGAISSDVVAVERSWTVGGRAGYLAAPDTLIYGLAGYTGTTFRAISYNLGFATGTGPTPEFRGVTVGGGFEKLFTNNVSARAEYRHTQLDTLSNLTAPGFTSVNADATVHTVRLILSYRVPTP